MRHATIPVFVPHLACPNNCVFCNQKRISGTVEPIKDIDGFLENAVSILDDRFTEVDIAFFGGSFTGIGDDEMRRYLSAAKRIREKSGRITGIRLSTRPDYINDHILDILGEYGVTNVELGSQSMCDDVLAASGRGHTASDTVMASKLIRDRGITLGLQMMTGLPGDSYEKDILTAERIISCNPGEVRIYPCVVVRDTDLEEMYLRGQFVPQTVDEAAELCVTLEDMFSNHGIKVLRMGLHSSDLVRDNSVVAGPFHPAFGEIVAQKRFLQKEISLISVSDSGSEIQMFVHTGELSKAVGQRRCNIQELEARFGIRIHVSESDSVESGNITISFQK